MGRNRSQTTFRDDHAAATWGPNGHYATELSDGARTVVAHGATPEESQERAAQLWAVRDKQLANAVQGKVDPSLRVAFEELVQSWIADTAHLSSPLKLIQHPAYRQIIGLGSPVLPLLLDDLAANKRYWFPALMAITGEDPVLASAEGSVAQMTEAWLVWGREHGLI